jgi:hypothetical protein
MSGGVSHRLRTAGIVARALFLVALTILVARVASPQHIGRTWFDMSLGDLVRAALGLIFCGWMLAHVFILPKDDAAYRTWIYLALAAVPLAIVWAIAIW